MPYMTSIERMGREEGRAEGRAEGLAEGKRQALLAVVAARFGTVPEALAARIAAAGEAELDDLLVRVSRVQSLDDL